MHTELEVIALQREEEEKKPIIDRLSYYCYLVKMLLTSTADLRNKLLMTSVASVFTVLQHATWNIFFFCIQVLLDYSEI